MHKLPCILRSGFPGNPSVVLWGLFYRVTRLQDSDVLIDDGKHIITPIVWKFWDLGWIG